MPNYKRIYESTTYFFTVVTHQRRPFLCNETSRKLLREAINHTRERFPFNIEAWVLLPDHIHCIWTLPGVDVDYSRRWGLIKAGFSKRMNAHCGTAVPELSASRQSRWESVYWQRRFWMHETRSQRDYNAHMDYVHYNPVKHGHVSSPKDWEFSSFHRLVREGVYDIEWGLNDEFDSMGIGHE